MTIVREERRYEDAAQVATVTGWACKRCNRWWGSDEHMARYCCATSFPCQCGNRIDKGYIKCRDCIEKQRYDEWYSKETVEWDGAFPLAIWNNDNYFFDEDELFDYLTEHVDADTDWSKDSEQLLALIDDIRLTSCEPDNGHEFCMSEFLQDSLPEDGELDEDEINKTVNDWIAANAPFSWQATGKRLCSESIKAKLRQTRE